MFKVACQFWTSLCSKGYVIIIEMQMLKFLESVQAEESNNLLYREHCSDLVSFRVAFVAMIFLIASIVLIKLIRSEEICRLSIYSSLPNKRTCTPYLILIKLPPCTLLFGPVRLFIFGIWIFFQIFRPNGELF